MDVDRFVEQYPRLYHAAGSGAWPSIRDRGLLSVTAMLDVFAVKAHERAAYESAQRTRTMEIPPGIAGTIALRDQRAIPPDRLAKALNDGSTPEDWYRLINAKVFFWAEESRLYRWLDAREQRRAAYDVLTLDTRRVADVYHDTLWLCHMNSGSTWPTPHTRGVDVFQRLPGYPALQAVVEVAIDYSMPEVANYVIGLRRMPTKEQRVAGRAGAIR